MRRILARSFIRAVSAAALATLVVSCTREPAPRSDADVLVAEVNGARISLKDLKNELAVRRGLSPSLSALSAGREEVREALHILIERAIVLSEGERLGVAVADAEVEKEIDRFRSDFPPGGLEKALLQAGMDMDAWRAELARTLRHRRAADAIADVRAAVSDEEVEAAFRAKGERRSRPERIQVRQFLFPSEESARDARGRVEGGEAPEEVLRRLAASGIRPTVAELGEVTRGDLPPEIAEELFSLEGGGVSGIVPREQSYSFFQVVRKEPAGSLTLAEAAPEIREELRGIRREEAFRSWLTTQMGTAKIRVRETILDRLTVGGAR